MTRFLALASLLAIMALTEGAVGPKSPRAATFSALLLVIGLLILVARNTERGIRWRGAPLIILGGAATFWWTSGVAQWFALAAVLGLATALARKINGARTATLAVFLLAAFLAIRDYLPLWIPLSNLAERISSYVAAALGSEARLGPTRYGFWTCAGALAIALATAATTGRRSLPLVATAALLTVLAPVGAQALDILVGKNPQLRLLWPGDEEAILLLLLLPIALLARAHGGETRPTPERRRVTLAMAGALLGLALLAGQRGLPESQPRILLDGRGGFSLDRLEWGRYGPDAPQGASLASFPDVLKAWGLPLTISTSTITPALLSEHDVLVVMNPKTLFDEVEHSAIWAFVGRGGGLLVLGDHTNILGTGAPLDSLLAPVGIHVVFDSAIPEVERWTWYGCARMEPHPVLRGVHDENDVKISVGASLALGSDAVPLILGRHAFSDAGDSTNSRGAFLGNMQPDPGERRGDLVLAAEARQGRGKVVVFGDTSPFQRGAISHSRELVLRILVYLGTPGHTSFDAPWRTAGAALLAGGCLLLVVSGASAGAVAGIAACAALGLLVIDRTARVGLPDADQSGFAWIDVSHGNRVDLHAGRDLGISGLTDQLTRHEWLPLSMTRFDAKELAKARAFVTMAPSLPYRAAERKALVRFVEDGGLLVVASGYEEGRGSASLLAEFGFTIGSTPLGVAHASRTLFEGGVLMNEAWPVQCSAGDATVLAETWDIPFISTRRVGRGAVLVIGDSRFLGDEHLETAESAVNANIEFFRLAIQTALAPVPSS